eukprot:2477208-Prymnesium_polylepis.1
MQHDRPQGAEPRRPSRQPRSSSSRARRRSRRQNEAGSLQSQCDVASPIRREVRPLARPESPTPAAV